MKKLILIFLLFIFHNSYSQWYQQVNPINKIIRHIDFVDSMKGWGQTKGDSSADTSFVIRTTNGGANWFVQYFQRGLNLDLIDFVNDSTGYLFGYSFNTHASTMLKTTNGGVNWIETQLSFGLGFVDCQFLNQDTGFVCQFSPFGGIWKTTDGGNSWVSIRNGITGDGFETVFFLNAETGWCGTASPIYKTTNGGLNWSMSFSGGGESPYKIFFSDEMHGHAGFANMFYGRTTNGGANWIYSKLIQNNGNLLDIDFINNNTGWMISGTKIFKSTDAGLSWGQQTVIPSSANLNLDISIIDSMIGYTTSIIKTTNGGGTFTSIKQINSNVVDKFILYQNYPNPFNPKTTIRFSLKENSSFLLSIYDLAGKLINKYNSNNTVSSGSYEVQFDASNLSSGTYFYKLEVFNSKNNLNYQETKKMMLIK